MKIAINGFGRIGRMFYRAMLERNMLDGKVEVVAANDIVPATNLAYLLKYDSIHRKLEEEVKVDGDMIKVGSHSFKTLSLKAMPEELPWKDLGVDLVVESTGLFTKDKKYEGHLTAGAKKVLISAPADSDVATCVLGVNTDVLGDKSVISAASCTTNCLAPVVHVLIKEGIGIEEGLMSTLHSYTADQELQDAPHKNMIRGRAAALNIVPTTTGAAEAVGLAIPEVKGKLTGVAFRVPTPDVSVVDLNVRTVKETSINEINQLMKKASETYLKGIMNYTADEVVSTDFLHDAHSSTYDANASMQLNSRFFKLVSWYDNEWGYVNRLVDIIEKLNK